ncbi:MAG TPA: fibronectin type III domain-containing protein, partial [Candidatus Kapabacteria bacterium]|nr:fibronectin type III domain-containing protein [Candidatus Kapabacteria bacterium]
MKKILFLIIIILFPIYLSSQTVNYAEYFFDNDPGLGNGTSYTIISGDTVVIEEPLSLEGLAAGIHHLCFRFRDDLGYWSFSKCSVVYIIVINNEPVLLAAPIVAAEYFIDNDPGLGLATLISLTPTDSVNILDSLSTADLALGIHYISYRFKDDNGSWSHTKTGRFYVIETDTTPQIIAAPIVAAEYYYDSDPGQGNGIPYPIAAGDTVVIMDSFLTDSLSAGIHALHFRFKDENGNWSMTKANNFYILDEGPAPEPEPVPIAKGEFYLDSDPGLGMGFPLNVSGDSVTIAEAFNTNGLEQGIHFLNYRFQDTRGNWSFSRGNNFYIIGEPMPDIANPTEIGYCEYFFDDDPGQSNAVPIFVSQGSSLTNPLVVNTEGLAVGKHWASVRMKDLDGNWSFNKSDTFNILNRPALLSPENNQIITTLEPIIDWTDVPGVTGYQIQISTQTSFATFLLNLTTTTPDISQYQIEPGLIGMDTSYYWRIRAVLSAGGYTQFSDSRKFTPKNMNIEILPLSQLSFINGSNISVSFAITGTFSSGNMFKLQLSDSAGSFMNPLILGNLNGILAGTINGVIPTNIVSGTGYRVRIVSSIPLFIGENNGDDLTMLNYQVPMLINPSNNSADISINEPLVWRNVPNATSYNLQVSNSFLFTSFVVNIENLADTSYALDWLHSTSYYWRVNANFGEGFGPWSKTFKFTTKSIGAPVLLFPQYNALNVTTQPAFIWNSVPEATEYVLQVSITSNFLSFLVNEILTDTTYNVTDVQFPSNALIVWHVKALIGSEQGNWSTNWIFRTEEAYSPPTLNSPLNNSINQPLALNLVWNAAVGTSYSLQVATDVDFTNIILSDSGLTSLSYQLSGLTYNTQYFWRVNITDGTQTSIWSNVWNFKTAINDISYGLVAYYPFNGNANDESGNEHHGVNNGATLTEDRF